MLAARSYEGLDEFRLEDLPVPDIREGEVLVRVKASGLAPGMLIMLKTGMIKLLPSTPGTEMAGEVAELGERVDNVRIGQRVRVHANLSCRRCARCLNDEEQMCRACSMIGAAPFGPDAMPLYERYHNGGLAEYVRAPAWLVDPLPDSIPFEIGAKIHVIAGANRSLTETNTRIGDTLVLTSGTGALGGVTVRLAEKRGLARVIVVGRSSERLAETKALAPNIVETVGLDEIGEDWEQGDALGDRIRALAPDGVDAVLDYTPQGPLPWHAAKVMRVGGTLVMRAARPKSTIELSQIDVMHGCWKIAGTRNGSRGDAAAVTKLLATNKLEVADLFTHRFALQDINEGVETMKARSSKTWFIGVDIP
jgi:threonine dehydrogenase-like Zn-dependent dehydrogenase